MERKPSRIVLAGGAFLLAMGIFAVCFLAPRPDSGSRQAALIAPNRSPVQVAAVVLLPPGPPPVARSIQQPAGAVPDPFAGGPPPPQPKPVKTVKSSLPPYTVVYVMPVPYPYSRDKREGPVEIHPVTAAPFRYAGMMINSGTGQVTAIVETRAGSREVRVGDRVDGWHLRGIACDCLTLDDGRGHLWSMEFTGTGDYQYRTRWAPRE